MASVITDVDLLESALRYAARSWPVFPLHHPVGGGCSCRDAGCQNIGKHPRTRHGLDDATTDADQISAWWARWPAANIGVRTADAFDVLDIDHDDYVEGVSALPDCETEGGPIVRTGSGWHIYLLPTGSGNRTKFVTHCDWRGRGGYVIAPPSLHASGRRYEWFVDDALALTDAPEELVETLQAPKSSRLPTSTTRSAYVPRAGGYSAHGLIGRVASASVGTRNDALNWAAFRLGEDLASGKVPGHEAERIADELVRVAVMVGLSESESIATVRSGYAKGVAA